MNELEPHFYNALNDNILSLEINVSELRFIGIDDEQAFLDFVSPDLVVVDVGAYPKAFGVGPYPDPNSSSYQYATAQIANNYKRDYEGYDSQFFDIPFIYAIAITRTIEEGITPEDIEDFRIALNANIRKISRNDSGEDIVRPEDGWANIEAKAIVGDVNYEGASGNCDIDENGDVITNFNIYKVVDNGDGTLSFAIIDNVSIEDSTKLR